MPPCSSDGVGMLGLTIPIDANFGHIAAVQQCPAQVGNAALLPCLNKAIAGMKKDGELDRLLMEELTR